MSGSVTLPVWLFVLILLFAAVTFMSHFLFPSVRWFFRLRLERAVEQLNARLERPIQPFKLARRHDTIQRLLYDPAVTEAIVDHARETGVREDVAFQDARRYAREIVPSFSASAYFGIAIRLAKLISTTLFRVRVGYINNEALRAVDPQATVVFVMNHRSNVDYVLVTYLAAERSALSYAVGEWARVWPLSRLIRAMGAYFIRRKSRNPLYRRVLAQYVRLATQARVTQAMFPEGGLSLNGALRPPKLGLLKYITDGHDPAQTDVVFIPVALNYDRVLEDKVLISAEHDPEHRFRVGIWRITRSILKLIWLRIRRRYHRFGYAAVSFGEPVSLNAHLAGSPDADAQSLATMLMDRIGAIVPVLPVPLIAAVMRDGKARDAAKILKDAEALSARLTGAHIHIPRKDMGYAVEHGLRNFVERGLFRNRDGVYAITPGEADTVEFYANSIAHLLPLGHEPETAENAAVAKEIAANARS